MPVIPLANLETGVMFWAGRDPKETLKELKGLGVRCGQLCLPGDLDLSCAGEWRKALHDESFIVYTVFAAYNGESYTDVPTVRDTVGFIPQRFREEREQRTLEVSHFAKEIGARGIATHIGCMPDDETDENYVAVREMVRRICDHAASHGQTFALETGQEGAEELRSFLLDTNRENLGINFDPANMILYGTGDPIEALGVLGQHVISVHCKDGDWPPAGQPDALGKERPLGKGAVNIERYLRQLKHVGYCGPLAVEREAEDPAERLRDLAAGIALVNRIKASLD